jgi:glutamine cyclotransferase
MPGPRLHRFLLAILLVAAAFAGPAPAIEPRPETPRYSYRVVRTYPHDPQAFTQGLEFADGRLYESTGQYGRSSLRRVDLETGRVLHLKELPEQYFGEGLTLFRNRIYQLTWREGKGLIYDQADFNLLGEFNYATEGWGLTHDRNRLIMSDGSDTLYFLDPATCRVTGQIQVRDGEARVAQLNELEYFQGRILANIWQTDLLAAIDPATGQVVHWIDLAGLLATRGPVAARGVLNGIAWDQEQNRLFVTGKNWPYLFEIELVAP